MVTLVPHLPELHSTNPPRFYHTATVPLFTKKIPIHLFRLAKHLYKSELVWLHQHLNNNTPSMLDGIHKYLLINVFSSILCEHLKRKDCF